LTVNGKTALESAQADARAALDPRWMCPTGQVLALVADRWATPILFQLGDGPCRSEELRRRLAPVTRKVLTETLRRLERDGLIDREVEETVPPAVTYAITPLGRSLLGTLGALVDWYRRHAGEVAAARTRFDG
jgi:DNA-binding HxlR family transcriptional regulator